jgi:hypothetical protein
MTQVLHVAVGGGGDTIAAAILASTDQPHATAAIATLSWDRLLVDPLPGPRTANDFSGLRTHSPGSLEITADTSTVPPARSLLPRLASELPSRIFLLDPTFGTSGLADQLRSIASTVHASRLELVDVGGDLVASGTENGLRSPLADSLILAACLATGLPLTAAICGPGLDGELTETEALDRCASLHGKRHAFLTAQQVQPFRDILEWHPSEATGLLIAAATGKRGTVEVRDAGSQVALTTESSSVIAIPQEYLHNANPYSRELLSASSLDEADDTIRRIRQKPTELHYERRKAKTLGADPRAEDHAHEPSAQEIDSVSDAARTRGADYVTLRRLSELLRPGSASTQWLYRRLVQHDRTRVDPPLWDVHRP